MSTDIGICIGYDPVKGVDLCAAYPDPLLIRCSQMCFTEQVMSDMEDDNLCEKHNNYIISCTPPQCITFDFTINNDISDLQAVHLQGLMLRCTENEYMAQYQKFILAMQNKQTFKMCCGNGGNGDPDTPDKPNKSKMIGIAVGCSVGAVVVVAAAVVLYMLIAKKGCFAAKRGKQGVAMKSARAGV